MADSTSSLHILLVDDDVINRSIAANLVRRLGHSSEAVESGKEALKRLAEEHFDLVLMDCQMPELNGYETTALIRSPLTCCKMYLVWYTVFIEF